MRPLDDRFKNFSLFLLGASVAFIYVCIRAYTLSITHDEALSWFAVNGDALWFWSPNNHWINTAFMYAADALCAHHPHPLALRLPNVLAFLGYAYGIFLWLKHFPPSRYALFAVMGLALFNPLLLDFFSLARGYGLAMCCLVFAAFFSMKIMHGENEKNANLLKASIFLVLMLSANYSFLLPFLAINLVLLDACMQKRIALKAFIASCLLQGIALSAAFFQILHFQKSGQLYAGENHDVLHDSLRSLIKESCATEWFPCQNWFLVFLSLSFWGSVFFIQDQRSKRFFTWLMFAVILIPEILHFATGALFGTGRTVIYILVIWAMLAVIVASETNHPRMKFWRWPMAIMALFFFMQWLTHLNFKSTAEWPYESDSAEILNLIEKNAGHTDSVHVAVTWLFEPSQNFYRRTQNHTRIAPIVRDQLHNPADFYYCTEMDFQQMDTSALVVIQRFPDSGSLLAKPR